MCHAAIVAAGYSAGLGFIHTGKMLSFVYDVADLYKTETTVPLAFRLAATVTKELERTVRMVGAGVLMVADAVEPPRWRTDVAGAAPFREAARGGR